jgi:hypothetical protein
MDVVASESLRPATANPSIEGRPALRVPFNQGGRRAWQESNLRNVPARRWRLDEWPPVDNPHAAARRDGSRERLERLEPATGQGHLEGVRT